MPVEPWILTVFDTAKSVIIWESIEQIELASINERKGSLKKKIWQ